jgi:glyoxylase-like metal-dependent hydrolase (beta-lactamase superfamily II)
MEEHMTKLRFDYRVLGMIGTNCYLLINEDEKQCILFDPADEEEEIYQMIEQSNCKLEAVFLTHGHYDHMLAAKKVCAHYGVKLYAGADEEEVLLTPAINLSYNHGMQVSITADCQINDGDEFNIAGIAMKAIHTPGHTKGGFCYYIPEMKMLISGDTLFAESVGRTDFPTGSMSQIVRSVKEKLLCLPEETLVFPGHGESTSIHHEKMYNPYCQ